MPSQSPSGSAVSQRVVVRRLRSMPGSGEVFVKKGDAVRADDVVAAIRRPGDVHALSVAAQLGLPRGRIRDVLSVDVGDRIAVGQTIAVHRALFGLLSARVVSPVGGIVELVSPVTGQVVVRADPTAIELKAYVSGRVVDVRPGEGVEIEAEVALLHGVLGLGGEALGELAVVRAGGGPLCAGDLGEAHRGAVVATFGRISLEAMHRAREVGAAALVGGSARGADLVELAGRELNLAATGDEEIGFALLLTEGLGDLGMSVRAAELLSKLEGQRVSVRGVTQVRAGVIRPELIGPPVEGAPLRIEGASCDIVAGSSVRIVRGKRFGAAGEVVSLPPEPTRIETGAEVLVYVVRLDDGDIVKIPRQNVERAG